MIFFPPFYIFKNVFCFKPLLVQSYLGLYTYYKELIRRFTKNSARKHSFVINCENSVKQVSCEKEEETKSCVAEEVTFFVFISGLDLLMQEMSP